MLFPWALMHLYFFSFNENRIRARSLKPIHLTQGQAFYFVFRKYYHIRLDTRRFGRIFWLLLLWRHWMPLFNDPSANCEIMFLDENLSLIKYLKVVPCITTVNYTSTFICCMPSLICIWFVKEFSFYLIWVKPKKVIKVWCYYDNYSQLLCGFAKLMLFFVCRNGLSSQMKQISFLESMPDDAQISREERSFRLWINSLGISTYINNVFEDLRDG